MSWKRPTKLKGIAFGIHPLCPWFITGVTVLGGRKGGRRVSENAYISEAERTRLGPHTELSPYRCAGGELGRVGAAAEVTVHDHEHVIVSKLAGRTPVIL